MWTYTLAEIANICEARIHGNTDCSVSGVFTDSRIDGTGKLFIALKGENFDGHDYVGKAASQGAMAAMVSHPVAGAEIPQMIVSDTLAGLTRFATAHRRRFRRKVAAVTGSAGKTTTRTLLASILRVSGKVLEPEKNFNNHIGVPLTALRLDDTFDAAVFELGCSDFNEIGPLTRIVSPDVGLITNVGEAHLEKLGNLEGVARAKGELFGELDNTAVAIINVDDPWISKMPVRAGKSVTFSTCGKSADVVLERRIPGAFQQQLQLALGGEHLDIGIALPGIHNAIDATAAAAAAFAMGTSLSDIKKGLASAKAYPGRFNILDKAGLCIVDDTYNANPSSMAASLSVLEEMAESSNRMAVLGDMLELGENSASAHESVGQKAAALKLKKLFVVGEFAEDVKKGAMQEGMSPNDVLVFDSVEKIAKKVVEISNSGDVLLIKGSRGMKLERVVHAITEG